MNEQSRSTHDTPPKDYPAEKARQGEVILNTPGKRMLFGGLFAGVAVILLVAALMQ